MALTDAQIRKAEPKDRIYRMFDSGGLYVEIAPSGGKWWRFKYRIAGKEKRVSLGTYPTVGLRRARELRDAKRELVARGEDPSHERAAARARAAAAESNSFKSVALDWYKTRQSGWTQRYATATMSRLEKDLFPDLGARFIDEITAPELLSTARSIEARGATSIARLAVRIAGGVFRFGIATGKCSADPSSALRNALATHVSKPQPSVKPADLPDLMKAIASYGLDRPGDESTRLGLQMLALTFLRTRELVEAPWDEFDLERATWKIGAERMKMRRPHIVPLSAPAIAVLGRLKEIGGGSAYILPGRNARVPMSNNTLLFALYRLGYRGRMTGHGFRSVASTVLNEQGFRPDVIERQLAHEEGNAVRAAYNHAEYLNERREMMEWWGQYLAPMLQLAAVAK